MINITYAEYRDRVLGCWLGKCVAGTIGAPYEGMKQLLDLAYDPCLIEEMLPNDDLDLQILWLEVLEKKGTAFTSEDLAEIFYTKCPYAPGEYAVFRKNYQRGLHPPYTGMFNNAYYADGMGSIIRSEIWACIAPGDPVLAAQCAAKDAVLDHPRGGASYTSELFMAALEALAFVEPDIKTCITRARELVEHTFSEADGVLLYVIEKVCEWCQAESDWRRARERILAECGHPDCTNVYQNLGFTLLALLHGEGDLIKTTMIAVNCGFDTDCTCATAGAILGIQQGAAALKEKHGFTDQGFKLSVNTERRSDRVEDLAEDTCLVGLLFAGKNDHLRITEAPLPPTPPHEIHCPLDITVHYTDHGQDYFPYNLECVAQWGHQVVLEVLYANNGNEPLTVEPEMVLPKGWQLQWQICDSPTTNPASVPCVLPLAAYECTTVVYTITVTEDVDVLHETNLLPIRATLLGTDTVVQHTFGLVGAGVWQVFGPFWENNVTVPPLKLKESYWNHVAVGTKTEAETLDRVRDYHVNAFTSIDKEYLPLDDLQEAAYGRGPLADQGRIVNLWQEPFSIADLVGWQGPCTVYLTRRLISPEARTVCLQIGHNDAFKLWINGSVISENDTFGWWTNENTHVIGVPLNAGENLIVLRLTRRSNQALFSLVFSETGTCSANYADFASVVPGRKMTDR